MIRLPLFPLPVVLFPGAPMPLHIFEPRYRQMVARCIEGDNRFGLIYHDPDRHGPFTNEPGQVGTVAEILKFEPLPDGRSLIYCRGMERFVIVDGVESGTAYYEAVVEEYEDEPDADEDIGARRRESVALFFRVLREAVGHDEELPVVDPGREVAFRIAQAIKIDPAWQQRLLETNTESARLDLLDDLLRAVLNAHARGEWSPEPD
ncbi:MAG TPA: LON peptidase substrate-binding domain-containing protein [Longimicrobium sp.]